MNYPSDLTREQFNEILPILEEVKKKTRPRKVDLYDIFNALNYVLVTCCQWRALPKDYPDWKIVYYYFTIWKETEVLDRILKKIGRIGAYKKWQEMLNYYGYCRRSKR